MTADLDLIRRAASRMQTDDDARWHPVADWLEGVAAWASEGLGDTDRLNMTNWPSMWGDMQVSALAVARAFLKEDA